MIVYYRIADQKLSASKPPPKWAGKTCFDIFRVCFVSFISAFKNQNIKVHFIADYCGDEYEDFIYKVCPFDYEYETTALGINETCLRQYTLFEKADEDIVLFQEYDYLWLYNTGREIEAAVSEADFITPYDHPDKYEKEKRGEFKIIGHRLWRKTSSTTATFATTRPLFDKYKHILYKYGYLDKDRWETITKSAGLWSPIPSIATHMVDEYLSPHINWLQTYKDSLP